MPENDTFGAGHTCIAYISLHVKDEVLNTGQGDHNTTGDNRLWT